MLQKSLDPPVPDSGPFAELESDREDCPNCGSWIPIQRLYEEFLRTRGMAATEQR